MPRVSGERERGKEEDFVRSLRRDNNLFPIVLPTAKKGREKRKEEGKGREVRYEVCVALYSSFITLRIPFCCFMLVLLRFLDLCYHLFRYSAQCFFGAFWFASVLLSVASLRSLLLSIALVWLSLCCCLLLGFYSVVESCSVMFSISLCCFVSLCIAVCIFFLCRSVLVFIAHCHHSTLSSFFYWDNTVCRKRGKTVLFLSFLLIINSLLVFSLFLLFLISVISHTDFFPIFWIVVLISVLLLLTERTTKVPFLTIFQLNFFSFSPI